MNASVASLLSDFEAAARSAQAAETELRKALAERVAQAERQRAFAFRRTRLVRTLAMNVSAEAEEAESWAAQRQAVADELGWTHISEAYGTILDRLRPVADAVRACLCTPEAPAASVSEQLAQFETWFESVHGQSFYALFDQYVSEVPVVDY